MRAFRRSCAALLVAPLAVLAVASSAWADDRYFPFSYPYSTADQGERELELYTDLSGRNGLENALEFEYGVTDRLTLSAYGYLAQLHQFNGYSLEGRYRLGEKNQWLVDPTLYAELENRFAEGPTLEGKLLLEKSLGPWIVDANLVGEQPLTGLPAKLGGTLGVGYMFGDSLVTGAEAVYDDQLLYVGPTVASFWGAFHLEAGAYYGGPNEVIGRLVLSQEF